ncbi:hypothetical protein TcCL_ESM04496 [Trypanosoma cruzi]|nr:hypothetical protein TcCL_Unassigned03599 [Trypanosoma cruzi]RNC57855.1 hypothetical protein TcCL_ESM04496 [Trypanosoma cruzi]
MQTGRERRSGNAGEAERNSGIPLTANKESGKARSLSRSQSTRRTSLKRKTRSAAPKKRSDPTSEAHTNAAHSHAHTSGKMTQREPSTCPRTAPVATQPARNRQKYPHEQLFPTHAHKEARTSAANRELFGPSASTRSTQPQRTGARSIGAKAGA